MSSHPELPASSCRDPLTQLLHSLREEQEQLLGHPIYQAVRTPQMLRTFMKYHAFAVFDFMSLLKRLQQEFTGSGSLWLPPQDTQFARFINEIVLGEESDESAAGGYAGHYELYLQAMDQIGADSSEIRQFVKRLRGGVSYRSALQAARIPAAVKRFTDHTLTLAAEGSRVQVTAAFCLGREDIIPEMFTRMLTVLQQQSIDCSEMRYYLERHIELDGDHHGPLSRQLLSSVIGDCSQTRNEAASAARTALVRRMDLWSAILDECAAEAPMVASKAG